MVVNACRNNSTIYKYTIINKWIIKNIQTLHPAGETIDSNEILSVDAEESDNEEVQDDDVRRKQQPVDQEPDEDDSFEKFLKFLAEKFPSLIKTREGRAGLIHNFLRGLQLPSATVPSGKKMSFVHLTRVTFFLLHTNHGIRDG